MTILSPLEDRIQYFKDQATELRKKALYERKKGNNTEADRLENLSHEARIKAQSLREQKREATS